MQVYQIFEHNIGFIIVISMQYCIFLQYTHCQEITYLFTKNDSSYTFKGSIPLQIDPDSALFAIYDEGHIKDYAMDPHSIKIAAKGNDWYDVEYIYKRLWFFENKSTWRRVIQKDKRKISFSMQESTNNVSFIPDLVKSSGYYQIYDNDTVTFVYYYQEGVLGASVFTGRYIHLLEKEAVQFLYVLKDYLVSVNKPNE